MADGDYVHPEYLVETDWLVAHLGDPKLVVLDCTTHLIPDPKITYTVMPGREDFEKGHIPGAQFVDLQADLSDKIQKTQSTVATLGGLLGAVTGQDKIANYANRSQIVVDVANDWKEIPFDQLNVVVRRDNDLNITLQDFTLISPTKRIAGTGEIRHADGTPVLAQALDLRLQLGARGKTFDLMNRAGLLNGQKDDLGYTGFLTPVRITGTLENPNTGEFRAALLKAAGGSLLNNLLGR